MKLPRRSLAYYWALSILKKDAPSWRPLLLVGFAMLSTIFGVIQEHLSTSMFILALAFLVSAAEAWLARGFREVFQEQQRLIEDARSSKIA
jgi:hypothetical protein